MSRRRINNLLLFVLLVGFNVVALALASLWWIGLLNVAAAIYCTVKGIECDRIWRRIEAGR